MEQQPVELTPKAERTRQHILDAALALFVEQGYEQTTLREIAEKAGCSLGLTYRYFAGKEDLVLALYGQLAQQVEARAHDLPSGRLADRFHAFMQMHLSLHVPYQGVLPGLFGAALNPRSKVWVLGDHTAAIRQQVSRALRMVVQGASDAPRRQQATELVTVLFGAHLGLVLFWLQDHSQERQATQALLTFTRDVLVVGRPLLRLPLAANLLKRLALIIAPFLRLGNPPEQDGATVEAESPGATEERTSL